MNWLGLHARSVANLVKLILPYREECEIVIEKDSNKVNAFSIIDVLTLGDCIREEITIYVNGLKEEYIMRQLTVMIENGFGE